MLESFDAAGHVRNVGRRLVAACDVARTGTTPGMVGDSIEDWVGEELEGLLPRGIAVGRGCVIDSYGKTSRQLELILYERDICPIFRISSRTAYYPCEGVMAVGEVKSVLDSESLRDAFTKTESVKRMRRHWDPSSEMVGVKRVKNYRQYGMEGTIAGIRADDENEEQERNEIFAFVVAGKTKIKAETIVDRFSRRASSHGSVTCPNVLAILEGRNAGYYRPFRCTDPIAKTTEPTLSFWTGDRVAYHDVDNSFGYLVHELFEAHTYGQTSSLQAFKRYLLSREDGVQRVIRVHALMGPKTTSGARTGDRPQEEPSK